MQNQIQVGWRFTVPIILNFFATDIFSIIIILAYVIPVSQFAPNILFLIQAVRNNIFFLYIKNIVRSHQIGKLFSRNLIANERVFYHQYFFCGYHVDIIYLNNINLSAKKCLFPYIIYRLRSSLDMSDITNLFHLGVGALLGGPILRCQIPGQVGRRAASESIMALAQFHSAPA